MLRFMSSVLLAVGVTTLLAGCGSSGGASAAVSTPLEASAAEARAARVDDDQLELLESGTVTYEDYELAMNRAYDCMREAGVTVDIKGVKKYHGVTVLDATTQTADGDPAISDDCYLRHARYVDAYWQVSSPDAIAYADRRADALKPLLRDCLTERGIDWPKDASFEELGNLAFDPAAAPDETNCLDEIGYSDWDG